MSENTKTDEKVSNPTPHQVSKEIARIRSAVAPGDGEGDCEDTTSYATHVVHLREAHQAALDLAMKRDGQLVKMIAQKEELLEALRWFIDDIDGTHTNMVDFDQNVAAARAAIASASSEVSR